MEEHKWGVRTPAGPACNRQTVVDSGRAKLGCQRARHDRTQPILESCGICFHLGQIFCIGRPSRPVKSAHDAVAVLQAPARATCMRVSLPGGFNELL